MAMEDGPGRAGQSPPDGAADNDIFDDLDALLDAELPPLPAPDAVPDGINDPPDTDLADSELAGMFAELPAPPPSAEAEAQEEPLSPPVEAEDSAAGANLAELLAEIDDVAVAETEQEAADAEPVPSAEAEDDLTALAGLLAEIDEPALPAASAESVSPAAAPEMADAQLTALPAEEEDPDAESGVAALDPTELSAPVSASAPAVAEAAAFILPGDMAADDSEPAPSDAFTLDDGPANPEGEPFGAPLPLARGDEQSTDTDAQLAELAAAEPGAGGTADADTDALLAELAAAEPGAGGTADADTDALLAELSAELPAGGAPAAPAAMTEKDGLLFGFAADDAGLSPMTVDDEGGPGPDDATELFADQLPAAGRAVPRPSGSCTPVEPASPKPIAPPRAGPGASEREPSSAEDWFVRGNECRRRGGFGQAIYSYRKAIALDGNCTKAYGNLAGVLFEMDRRRDAVDILEIALQNDPGNAIIAQNLRGLKSISKRRRKG